MNALTLRQPWASLVDVQAKKLETRSWSTEYRGPLVICASMAYTFDDYEYELRPEFLRHLRGAYPDCISLPRGVALCVVNLLAVVKVKDIHKLKACGLATPTAEELLFGNFTEGRFIWALEYVRRLEHRPSVSGAQGLWTFPESQLFRCGRCSDTGEVCYLSTSYGPCRACAERRVSATLAVHQ